MIRTPCSGAEAERTTLSGQARYLLDSWAERVLGPAPDERFFVWFIHPREVVRQHLVDVCNDHEEALRTAVRRQAEEDAEHIVAITDRA